MYVDANGNEICPTPKPGKQVDIQAEIEANEVKLAQQKALLKKQHEEYENQQRQLRQQQQQRYMDQLHQQQRQQAQQQARKLQEQKELLKKRQDEIHRQQQQLEQQQLKLQQPTTAAPTGIPSVPGTPVKAPRASAQVQDEPMSASPSTPKRRKTNSNVGIQIQM